MHFPDLKAGANRRPFVYSDNLTTDPRKAEHPSSMQLQIASNKLQIAVFGGPRVIGWRDRCPTIRCGCVKPFAASLLPAQSTNDRTGLIVFKYGGFPDDGDLSTLVDLLGHPHSHSAHFCHLLCR
jgi:hypothetical protein